jgi:capsular polysaccharide transport system ATP-binding protein
MIVLNKVTKSYKTPHGRHYVFRDLDLTIPEGKSVGLIGRNGAGKSTLLRMLGGIDRPDSGEVITDKSISWPVGLAGGFQGSMTGRENAKFVCRIYAEEADMAGKLDFVQEFAELGEYFDMPVNTYSSGMRSRLAFGLSMAFDFDYYIIDEVTAVGDASFKRKSGDILRHKKHTANFLMVSHSMDAIKKYCDIALLIGRGEVSIYHSIDEAIKVYQKDEASSRVVIAHAIS